ncbi:MAG: Ribonuclease HII [candidate division WS6 bacterium GW2011_GWF2_39_15]|uniref:Ribonuclease HII n=1 Tax=candidate division WS6 bacterium GW2011_GWF2_39_15 TaxID=1619100 RepID=A0A0G0MSB2_9BACT|nr:MAG: Ribonuclease HII [candidate division WS6 bacterium GW2011_GWF2_39_15]
MILPSLDLEKSLWAKGYENVAGLDEVGRGPLAGPVVAGVVVINKEEQVIEGVRDSKKLSEKKREELSEKIVEVSAGYGIGFVGSEEIDMFGIAKAVNLAMTRAVEEMVTYFNINPGFLIIDGKAVWDISPYPCLKMDKGDLHHYSIAAASIIAKVARDNLMKEYAAKYPNYGFDSNVGYGTKKHLEAIQNYGICDIHRKSFHPISNFVVNTE